MPARTLRPVESPIVFWPSEQDQVNLGVIAAAGLTGEAAIRAAIASLAVECTPVALALTGATSDR